MEKKYLRQKLSKMTDSEYQDAILSASYILDTDDGEDWYKLILRIAKEIRRRNGLEEAIKYLDSIGPDYERVFNNLFDKSAGILKLTCLLNLENNTTDSYNKAKNNIVRYIYITLLLKLITKPHMTRCPTTALGVFLNTLWPMLRIKN